PVQAGSIPRRSSRAYHTRVAGPNPVPSIDPTPALVGDTGPKNTGFDRSSASDTTSRVEEPVTLPRTHTLVSVAAPAHTHSTLIHSTPGCNAARSSCTRARLRPEAHTASRHPPAQPPASPPAGSPHTADPSAAWPPNPPPPPTGYLPRGQSDGCAPPHAHPDARTSPEPSPTGSGTPPLLRRPTP